MEYTIVTSHDNHSHDITIWLIVFTDDEPGYAACPFENVNAAIRAAKDWSQFRFTAENEGFAELLDAHERGADTFPCDDMDHTTALPGAFPYLQRFTAH